MTQTLRLPTQEEHNDLVKLFLDNGFTLRQAVLAAQRCRIEGPQPLRSDDRSDES